MSIFGGRIFAPYVFPGRIFPHSTSSLLHDGTLVSSNLHPTSVIISLLTEAFGGDPPYTHQLARALGAGAFVDIPGATGLSYSDFGLTPSTTYRYRDTVTDSLSQTVTSNIVTITTQDAPVFGAPGQDGDIAEAALGTDGG